MEEILIPMVCLYDIPSLNEMSMPAYKAGDIFMFNPYHEIHVELDEHGVFKEVEDNLCDFFCAYPELNVNGTKYSINEKITDKDIKSLDLESLRSLCYIGYINKRLKEKQKDDKPSKPKTQNKKKIVAETYATIASKLGLEKTDFKKACFDALGIEVKDMRKKCPKNEGKKIIKALGAK